jgi:hypothetical protein
VQRAEVALELLRWCAERRPLTEERRQALLAAAHALPWLAGLEIDSLWYLALGRDGPDQQAYDRAWECQLAAMLPVVRDLEGAGVQTLVLKSAELVPSAYGPRALGFLVDADLLVPRGGLGEARRVLYAHGFRQAFFDSGTGRLVDRDVRDIAQIEGAHYELAPFCRTEELALAPAAADFVRRRSDHPVYVTGGRPVIVLEIDVHHAIASDVEPEPLLERAVPSCHGVGSTLSPADHLWFLLTRHYNEVALHGKTSLRTFAYALPLVASGAVDWVVVSRIAAELSLGPTLYYYLAFLDRLAPGHVPRSLLDELHPCRNPRIRDWGWQLAKLFETTDPFPLEA